MKDDGFCLNCPENDDFVLKNDAFCVNVNLKNVGFRTLEGGPAAASDRYLIHFIRKTMIFD